MLSSFCANLCVCVCVCVVCVCVCVVCVCVCGVCVGVCVQQVLTPDYHFGGYCPLLSSTHKFEQYQSLRKTPRHV